MDKKTFISELKQALSVLQEEELNDIISEYEQHIDMKQASGLTEEEAIADFGSLSELAAEILEAYHVRADYAAGPKRREAGAVNPMKGICLGAGAAVLGGMKGLGDCLWGIWMFWKQVMMRPIGWMAKKITAHTGATGYRQEDFDQESENVSEDEREQENEGRQKTGKEHFPVPAGKGRMPLRQSRREAFGMGRKMCRGAGVFIDRITVFAARMIRFLLRAALWGVCMAWNAVCIGFALFCGLFGLLCLYCLGLLVVLLMQGYPLAGVTLGCLGLVMCSFSAAWLSVTLLRRRSGKSVDRSDSPMRGDGMAGNGGIEEAGYKRQEKESDQSKITGRKETEGFSCREREVGQHA